MASRRSSLELLAGPSHPLPSRLRGHDDRTPRQVGRSLHDIPSLEKDHSDHHSDHRPKRRRVVAAPEVGDARSSSRGSSREFDSHLVEPSELSYGKRGKGMIRNSTRSRTNCLPSPPPERSKGPSHGWSHYPSSLERRSRDLHGFGSWCGTASTSSPELYEDTFGADEDPVQYENPVEMAAPSSPREWLMPAPELSPLPIDYVFCSCCKHDEDRINETWHMARRDKMDVQVENAMEYIARMRSKGAHG